MIRRTLIAIALALCFIQQSTTLHAQEETYRFDIGAGIGMSGYLGDVNESNVFKHPGFAGQISFRYLFDTRWAVRTLLTTASLSGNSADFDMVFPGGAQYSFKSQIYDLGARGEFNFFNYGIGETYKRLRRWTPYLAIGIGVTMASANGTFAAMTLPMAFGVKFKLRPRLNLMAEFAMTKAFGDNLDDKLITDLYQIKSSFLKNTDWYSTIIFSISYEFGKRCATCHYVD